MKRWINVYPEIAKQDDEFFRYVAWSIEKVFEELQSQGDEESLEIVECVRMVLVKKTHDYNGAAFKLGLPHRTVRRRIEKFVYLVGEKLGFQ